MVDEFDWEKHKNKIVVHRTLAIAVYQWDAETVVIRQEGEMSHNEDQFVTVSRALLPALVASLTKLLTAQEA